MSNNNNAILHARIMGVFFLLAFVFYGVGRHLFDAVHPIARYVGAALIVLNSTVVCFIGIFLRKTLQQFYAWIGGLYLMARIVEAVALASVILNLWPGLHFKSDNLYFGGMLALGLASIPMCWVLFKYRLTPAWLAIWGLVGYSIFSVGFLMELFGKQWSLYLLGVGGLWEVVFACWLIIKNGRHQKAIVLKFKKTI